MLIRQLINWLKYSLRQNSEMILISIIIFISIFINISIQYYYIFHWPGVTWLNSKGILLISSTMYIIISLIVISNLEIKYTVLVNYPKIRFHYFINYILIFIFFHSFFELSVNVQIFRSLHLLNFLIYMLYLFITPILYYSISYLIKYNVIDKLFLILVIIFNVAIFSYELYYIMYFIIIGVILRIKKIEEIPMVRTSKKIVTYNNINLANQIFIYYLRNFNFWIWIMLNTITIIFIMNIKEFNMNFRIYMITFQLLANMYALSSYWFPKSLFKFESNSRIRLIYSIFFNLLIKITMLLTIYMLLSKKLDFAVVNLILIFLIGIILVSILELKVPKMVIELILLISLFILQKYLFTTNIIYIFVLMGLYVFLEYEKYYKKGI